jgi:hypothetical protein
MPAMRSDQENLDLFRVYLDQIGRHPLLTAEGEIELSRPSRPATIWPGASNPGIARCLWVTEGTVEKHVRSILTKLTLPETTDDHRRVLAVLAFLDFR